VRAYDAENGKVLWTSPQGGDVAVRGSPALYQIDGREYMLAPISTEGAVQYISFALSRR
jgi:hypothetical protein